jgi:hypothetical protein
VEAILEHLLGNETVRYEITENNLILIYPAGRRPGNAGTIHRPETDAYQQARTSNNPKLTENPGYQ